MSEKWVNYTLGGYDEGDGLDGGRWMFDDERRCQVWVQIDPAKAKSEVVRAKRSCFDCARPIGPRATYCDTCGTRRRRQAKREHMARVRSETAA